MFISLVNKWFKKPKEPTQEEKIFALIDVLKNRNYDFVYSSYLSLSRISVIKPNITELITYLRKINNQLAKSEEVYPRTVNLKPYMANLSPWFVVDGKYTEPTEQMQLMLDEVRVFMELYFKHVNMLNRTYNQDSNVILVGSLCGNLLSLLKDIEHVSHKSIHTGLDQADKDG